MKERLCIQKLLALCAMALCGACAESPSSVNSIPAGGVALSVCEVVSSGSRYEGQRLAVRGQFVAILEIREIREKKCPSLSLVMARVADGVDVSLCSSVELSDLYGCPVNPDLNVAATFVGVYRQALNDGQVGSSARYGYFEVESMSDVRGDVAKVLKKAVN